MRGRSAHRAPAPPPGSPLYTCQCGMFAYETRKAAKAAQKTARGNDRRRDIWVCGDTGWYHVAGLRERS